MTVPFSLNVYLDDLCRIVQSVFRTMLDLEASACQESWARSPDNVTSAVYFVGEWRGAVLVECDARPACAFAARFMGIGVPAAIDDDVRDVMGELANMVAGNLKSLLPRGVDLSMPAVVEGSDYSMRICGVTALEHMSFTCDEGNFRVTIIEMLQPA